MNWRCGVGFRIVTADLDRAALFYSRLGFTVGARSAIGGDETAMLGLVGVGTRLAMGLGPSRMDLDAFEHPGHDHPADADAAALSFQHLAPVTDDAAGAWQIAERAGAVAISRNVPATLPQSADGVTAVKFGDPDGHPVELLQFPDGAAHDWRGFGILGNDPSACGLGRAYDGGRRFYASRGLMSGRS